MNIMTYNITSFNNKNDDKYILYQRLNEQYYNLLTADSAALLIIHRIIVSSINHCIY